jgi:hypothetical protein
MTVHVDIFIVILMLNIPIGVCAHTKVYIYTYLSVDHIQRSLY